MGRKSRDKGKRLERQARDLWREAGWECERTAQHRGSPHSADVQPARRVVSPSPTDKFPDSEIEYARPLPVHVEVKGGKNTPNIYNAMAQAKRDSGDGDMPVVMVKRDRCDWLVVLTPDDFFKLLREWL